MKRILEMIVLLPVAGFALPVLIDSALKGAVLMAVILLTVLMLRSASAALRHLVLIAAMVGLLVLPLLSLTLPGWRVLPAWAQTRAVTEVEAMASGVVTGSDYSPQATVSDLVAPVVIETVEPTQKNSSHWVPLAVWAWLLGGVVLGLRLLLSQWALWRLGRTALQCADDGQLEMLDGLRSELGIRRQVEWLLHSDRAMPMTWGIFKTKLLLPAESSEWQEERLRAVLLHELAHVKRRDCLTQLLVQAVCAVHWFNPLVWVAARRIAAERERACDDLVLNSGIRASDYAEHLLRIATGYEDRPITATAALAMAGKSRLEGRLTSILNQRTNRSTTSRRVALCVAFSLALLALPVAMMRAVAVEDPEQKSLEELAAEWADETIAEEEPTVLYKVQTPGAIEIEDWFLEPESLLDPTKRRSRYLVQDPRNDGGMVSLAFAADHYSEKYKGSEVMRDLAESRSELQEEAREFEKKHFRDKEPIAFDDALNKIEREIVKLGQLITTSGTFGANTVLKEVEKQALLDSGLAENHPKIIGLEAEIAEGFIKLGRVDLAVRDVEAKSAEDSRLAKYLAAVPVSKPFNLKVNPAEAFFLEGGEENIELFQRRFPDGATNLRNFDYPVAGSKAPRPATFKDPRTSDKWEETERDDPVESSEQKSPKRQSRPDPADVYLEGYLRIQDAEAFVKAGEIEAAITKYRKAQRIFKDFKQRFPLFEPNMVDFRTRRIERELAELSKVVASKGSKDGEIRKKLDEKILELAQLRQIGLGSKHPAVVGTETEIEALQRALGLVEMVGIGITIRSSQDGKKFFVELLLKGAPAVRGGDLKEGDRILAVAPRIEDEMIYLEGKEMSEVVGLIRGEIGVPLRLLIERETDGSKVQRIVSIVRERLVLSTYRQMATDSPIQIEPMPPVPNLDLFPELQPAPPAAGDPVLLSLTSVDAGDTKQLIDGMLGNSKRGRVVVDETTNSLIYIGDAATLKLVRTMLEWLDEPAKK